MIDLPPPRPNRAVSALFRVFGGADARGTGGEGELRAPGMAMHAGEQGFFGVLFPLTVFVAAAHAIHAMLGVWWALVLAVPVTLVLFHVLPFILAGRSPRLHWWLWLAAATVWAWFHRDGSLPVAIVAWMWLGIALANLLSLILFGLRATMDWQGGGGVAWRGFLLIAAHLVAIALGWMFGWAWALVGGVAIAAIFCLAVLRPNAQWLGNVLRQSGGPPLLTFDDGPHPDTTPALLDLLDARGIKALFFLIGETASRHPDLVREIARRGHEIGNHTLTHPQATFWCAGPWRTAREIRGCQDILAEITGTTPRYFRAPVGHRNLFTHPVASALGLQVVGWTRRGFDADPSVPAATVIARIAPRLRHGDLVLLHDGHPETCTITDAILPHAR